MSAFDNVIGYETIKNELLQICDMLHNREVYESLGAKLPHGLMIHGIPGIGKSLMAQCFIKESGLDAYTIRRNKGNDDFISDITRIFHEAGENAPCIVFLDDMDKYANEDDEHCDTEEYVAVQSGIDEVKNKEVFVLATANELWKLPDSLMRPGRFDRKIEMKGPSDKDAEKIIAYYLSDKKVASDVNMEDLAKMISYSSCAELETILNEAAIKAAFARKSSIDMADLVRAVLRMQYDSPDDHTRLSDEEMQKIALHEAGHVVVAEVLAPGTVGLASLRSTGRSDTGGFVHQCKKLPRQIYSALIALAGKAAVELYYSDTCAIGCFSDIRRAVITIRNEFNENVTLGFGTLDVISDSILDASDSQSTRTEALIQAELERCMFKVKDILIKNRSFLEKTVDALVEKETLLYSDIQRIKKEVCDSRELRILSEESERYSA